MTCLCGQHRRHRLPCLRHRCSHRPYPQTNLMNIPRNVAPVRIGVVGLGRFGRLHSLTLAGLAEAELMGVVARRQESLDALARELPHVRGWLDLDRAIAESGAEAW